MFEPYTCTWLKGLDWALSIGDVCGAGLPEYMVLIAKLRDSLVVLIGALLELHAV